MELKENLDTLFDRLENFFRTETVIGEPINVGEVTLVPVIEVAFGLGAGGGSEKDAKGNDGTGAGTGVGAKIAPTSILVVKDNDVSLINLRDKGSMEQVLEIVPDILDKVRDKSEKSDGAEEPI